MRITTDQQRQFGTTPLRVPPIAFGGAALGDAGQTIPDQTKTEICIEWFRNVAHPVLIDTDSTDAAALQMLARTLTRLDVSPDEVVISCRLGCNAQSGFEPLQAWSSVCRLLGDRYRPQLVALDAVDEYVSAAPAPDARQQRVRDVRQAVAAMNEAKRAGELVGVGIAARDWRVVEELESSNQVDWIMLQRGFSVLRRPAGLHEYLSRLASRRIAIVCSGVLESGLLVGGASIEAHRENPQHSADRLLVAWRKSFLALCHAHGVAPAHACVQFALRAPGLVAVVLCTSRPDRTVENAASVAHPVPDALWESMRDEGLLEENAALWGSM